VRVRRERWLRLAPDLRGSSRATLAPDLAAGLTVAALAVPQGLAYALVAGAPPEMGLLAAALPTTVAALFGSSPFLVTGPTNPIALVVGSAVVAPALAAGARDPVPAILGTGLVAGLLLLLFGLAGIGRASRFLSDSVIAGFATGAGLLIALGILPRLGGPVAPTAREAGFVPGVWPVLESGLAALRAADWRELALALAVPLAAALLRRRWPRFPGALAMLALASGLAWALGWLHGASAIASLGQIDPGWPRLAAPPLLAPDRVLSPALAIAILATLQSLAAARAVAPASAPPLDADRELVGQGAANVVAASVGAIPTCGSLSRSAQLRAAGGRTRAAAAASGLAVAFVVPLAAGLLAFVPMAALVGLVVQSGLDLVNPRALRRASATRGDAAVLVATLVATLWIDLVQALYAGVFLSLVLLVRRAGQLQLVEIVRAGGDRFREIPIDARTGTTPAVLLHLEGDLNFAVAPELLERLREIAGRGPGVLVLRLKRVRYLDATVLESLRRAFAEAREAGVTVLVCGLTDELAAVLEGSELAREIGPDALLRTGSRLFEGFQRALDRTVALLAPRDPAELFRREEVPADEGAPLS